MRILTCENCGKHYNFEKDDFCPKCGAFNQPNKTWVTDSQGNVRRADGVNEVNHAGSFVHSEVHREKRVRQAVGLDRTGRSGQQPKIQAKAKPRPQSQTQKQNAMTFVKIVVWIMVIIGVLSYLSPFFGWLLMR